MQLTLSLPSQPKYEKDLTGASVDTTISLTQFKADIQPTSGTKYDVHIDIESDSAVYDVKVDIDPLYNELLNAAIKVKKIILTPHQV